VCGYEKGGFVRWTVGADCALDTGTDAHLSAFVCRFVCCEKLLGRNAVFRREVDENGALLGCYTTSSNSMPTFRDNQPAPSSQGSDRLFRHDGKELPLLET
jgi:hypothetical protein